MAEPILDPKCPNCGESIVNMKDHFRDDYEFPQWQCRVPALDPDIKCPNCKEVVTDTTDHFQGEFGATTWTCNRKKRDRIDKGPERYNFDIMDKWEIVIYANGNEWKTIRCNGQGSVSEMKIDHANNIN